MKVVGFSFVRNAIKYDYPIAEALLSIAPICDEIVIAVGSSDDNTMELVSKLPIKNLRILETTWDDSLRKGGKTLALETDKAFSAIASDADWAFYIQGDEVIHEKYLPVIKEAMHHHLNNKQVDGLLFNYKHFYGSYDYVGDALRWYRREIRVVRNDKSIYSYRDAQGFRKGDNQKLNVKLINAEVFHYGWVKDPRAQQRKQENFHKMWHNDEWLKNHIVSADNFDYGQIDALKKFTDTHPKVMQDRIKNVNWQFEHDISTNRYKFKDRLKKLFEQFTGVRIGEYKNYNII